MIGALYYGPTSHGVCVCVTVFGFRLADKANMISHLYYPLVMRCANMITLAELPTVIKLLSYNLRSHVLHM